MNLLQMSFSGAVMILAVITVRFLGINKLPKKTFLVLWELVLLRLLVPFTISSMFSVYSLIPLNGPALDTIKNTPAGNFLPIVPAQHMAAIPSLAAKTRAGTSIPVWAILWLAGVFACALYFTLAYKKCRQEFQSSSPADNAFTKNWLSIHQLKRPVSIRQSWKISAPLTYGILHPVILVPKSTDWENTEPLNYMLAHEYIHIKRFDSLTKMILAAALCIHWFNPLVWTMYILSNRDIELSCDEAVVRLFGVNTKSAYARTLIGMEEVKSGLTPMCNNFSKNAIKERITAIMKIRKTSLLAILAAVALVTGVAAALATSASASGNGLSVIPGTNFTNEEYEKLFALQYEGYENMTVAQYRENVLADTDTEEYMALLDRFYQDETIYELRDTNETAGFLCYIVAPLYSEKWLSKDYSGYAKADYSGTCASLEYFFTLSILDENTLTVQEYNNARIGFIEGLQAFLNSKTPEELYDDSAMKAACALEIDRLAKALSFESLKITAGEFVFMPLEYYEPETDPQASDNLSAVDEIEPRQYPYGTQEDYQSLLALKTEDYQKMTVADFDAALLDWANADFDRTQRIQEDIGRNDYKVTLSDDELSFAVLTMTLSNEENHQMIVSLNTGNPEEDPWYGGISLYKDHQGSSAAWCSLWYQFTYHISHKDRLLVGDRDRLINGFINEIQASWNETNLDGLLLMTEEDIVSYMKEAAAKYSNELLTIIIDTDQVQFEQMDERNLHFE